MHVFAHKTSEHDARARMIAPADYHELAHHVRTQCSHLVALLPRLPFPFLERPYFLAMAM